MRFHILSSENNLSFLYDEEDWYDYFEEEEEEEEDDD